MRLHSKHIHKETKVVFELISTNAGSGYLVLKNPKQKYPISVHPDTFKAEYATAPASVGD